jgi:hypothetical protein
VRRDVTGVLTYPICLQRDEANSSIRWYEGRIEELENSDTERRMRQHQADLASVREATSAEISALRAQLLAASVVSNAAGAAVVASDEAVAEGRGGSEEEGAAGVGGDCGGKGCGRYGQLPENTLTSLLFGDDGSDASEGGFAASSDPESEQGEQHASSTSRVPPTEGAARLHEAAPSSSGEARDCIRCRELQRTLHSAAAAAGVPGDAPPNNVAVAVAAALTNVQQALHDERMRSQALLFTLESQGSMAVTRGRGDVAAPTPVPPVTAEQGAQTEGEGFNLISGDGACTTSPKGPSDGSCAAPPSCAHTDSDARSHSASSEAMLAQVTAELVALQAVNTRLLAKIEALQAKLQPGKLVPVAEARQLVARVKEAAASQVKVRLDAGCAMLLPLDMLRPTRYREACVHCALHLCLQRCFLCLLLRGMRTVACNGGGVVVGPVVGGTVPTYVCLLGGVVLRRLPCSCPIFLIGFALSAIEENLLRTFQVCLLWARPCSRRQVLNLLQLTSWSVCAPRSAWLPSSLARAHSVVHAAELLLLHQTLLAICLSLLCSLLSSFPSLLKRILERLLTL